MRTLLAAVLVATGLAAAAPAVAQSNIEMRVDRLESEMHAVQRKVFPGGAGQNYVEPQIAPTQQAPTQPGFGGTGSAFGDLNSRVSSLEQQMSTLTNSVEETQHRLQVMQQDFTEYKRITDQRLAALEGGGAAAGPANGPVGGGIGGPATPAGPRDDAAPADGPAAAPAGGGTAAVPATAIGKPDTGDAEEDAYIYGYRLWSAKQYPAAEKQLKAVVEKYPDTRRWSFAQNLLGRTYLDEGKPALASMAFYDNYKKMPDGERAPDSLYYLAQALVQLKKPADACKVYGELTDVYGGKISAGMQANIADGRRQAHCQ
ncbi:MAG: tetratricopeptide repeat protein [Sphingomonas sp.]